MDDMDLVSLFCSRICHDLISPVGAVGNGLELLAEDDPVLALRPEFRLAAQSASRTSDAIAFFRLAFGGAAGGPVAVEDLAAITVRHLGSERLSVIGPASTGILARNTARMVLMLALTGAAALPRGGRLAMHMSTEVRAAVDAPSVERVAVEATGRHLRLDPVARAALEDLRAPSPAQPRDAHLVALTRLARSTGALLRVEETDSVEGPTLLLSAIAPATRRRTKAAALETAP